MGARGPKPKKKAALRFTPGVPPPPACLNKEAAAEYTRIVSELALQPDHLQQVDMMLLTVYAQSWAEWAQLTTEIKTEGTTCRGEKADYLNPKCSARAQAWNMMNEAAKRLCLSPNDRARHNSSGPPTSENALASFLAKPKSAPRRP